MARVWDEEKRKEGKGEGRREGGGSIKVNQGQERTGKRYAVVEIIQLWEGGLEACFGWRVCCLWAQRHFFTGWTYNRRLAFCSKKIKKRDGVTGWCLKEKDITTDK